jgi:hypothetical protein
VENEPHKLVEVLQAFSESSDLALVSTASAGRNGLIYIVEKPSNAGELPAEQAVQA